MSVQTSIVQDPAQGYAGQLSDAGHSDIISRLVEVAVSPGQPVLRGSSDNQCKAIENGDTLDASTALGFAALSTTRDPASSDPVSVGRGLPILKQGRIFVELTGDATAGQGVFVGTATAQLGDIQGTTGTGLSAFPGARFEQSGASGDIVEISLGGN